jgi:hypothetical protein
MTLPDTELLAGFEAGTLAPGDFHHADHVHVAWLLLRERSVPEVLERFSAGLRRLAAAAGKPGLYHETITWAYVLLIHERMARDGVDSWAGFAAQNPDLFTWKPSILDAYYEKETLASELARRVFLLPDRRG